MRADKYGGKVHVVAILFPNWRASNIEIQQLAA